MAADRLSELPDDLLHHILHFAPLKEAASTTALSRRWRAPLYLSSSAINLDTGGEKTSRREDSARFFSYREAFDSAAVGVLDAATVPVTRLTLHLDYITRCRQDKEHVVVQRYTKLVNLVLSHRAARGVEELRLDAKERDDDLYTNWEGFYRVTPDSLPSATLRVLELNTWELLYPCPATALVFPRLSYLRLSHSRQDLSYLQHVIDAAPALALVRLEHVHVLIDAYDDEDDQEATTRRLRCPAATMLVLDSCVWTEERRAVDPFTGYPDEIFVDVHAVEIEATSLCRFRYKGPLLNFSFSPLPLELEQVDLDVFNPDYKRDDEDPNRDLENFWRFVRSFSNTKEMRLSVDHLEDIAVLSEPRRVELLPVFHRLERLELQGVHWMKVDTTTVMAILNLLRCCPVLSALRINLTAMHEDTPNNQGVHTRTPQKEIQIAALLGPSHFYQCLQSSLTRVGLQFQLEKSDCLGLKLIIFFAENAMVLEEMFIDGGNEKLCEHLNPKIEKWNSIRRKLGATSFMVLPLKK